MTQLSLDDPEPPPDDSLPEPQLLVARELFEALCAAPEGLRKELECALQVFIESHYALMQSGPGRSAVGRALLVATMRASGIEVENSLWPSLPQYEKALTRYVSVHCRFRLQEPPVRVRGG